VLLGFSRATVRLRPSSFISNSAPFWSTIAVLNSGPRYYRSDRGLGPSFPQADALFSSFKKRSFFYSGARISSTPPTPLPMLPRIHGTFLTSFPLFLVPLPYLYLNYWLPQSPLNRGFCPVVSTFFFFFIGCTFRSRSRTLKVLVVLPSSLDD